MLTLNALQALPGNVYILLALLALICILLILLLVFLLRGNKRASHRSDTFGFVADHPDKPEQHASQKLWYQQSLQEQSREGLGSDPRLPAPHNIRLHQPVQEQAEQNNASSGMRQVLQPLSREDR